MKQVTEKMREVARELLISGRAQVVIGWEKGSEPYLSPPAFITSADQADRLLYDEFAVQNLAVYLLDYRDTNHKVAIFVKGCDSRGVIQLLQEKQLPRERIIVIGVPCRGKRDKKALVKESDWTRLPLLSKCQNCSLTGSAETDISLFKDELSLTGAIWQEGLQRA